MAGWATITPVSFNSFLASGVLPVMPPATPGYDTGSPGGTFTTWASLGNNAILIPNNGQVILLYWNGTTAVTTVDVLVGQQVGTTGQPLPAGTETYTIAASTYGWLGPWNANTYNIVNISSNWGTLPGVPGVLPASAQGCVGVTFSAITTLAVRAMQILPA